MKVLIVGANGNTGQRIVHYSLKAGLQPRAMIRSESQAEHFHAQGVETALGDLESPIDSAVQGCDALIFAAGSGSNTGKDKTVLIDHIGAIRAAVTAQVQGCRRFIMLSATNTDVNSTSAIAHYHRAKAHADNFLKETDLDWTIVCPGRLHDEPAPDTGFFSRETQQSIQTSRDLLAKVLVACLNEPHSIGKQFALGDGDTPIREGIQSL